MYDKLSEGRTLRYVSKDGVEHPCIVVRVFPVNISGEPTDKANIQVFLDGQNDLRHGFSEEECARGLAWRTSVYVTTESTPFSMHWPKRS